jgi:XTP/dITP diphosphohydrolase
MKGSMVKSLLFASTNQHKLEEIRQMLPPGYDIQSLNDIGWYKEIPEPFETFEENAAAKTTTLFEATGLICFAEDSGLEIDALDGRPGVYSARYAGTPVDSSRNIEKRNIEKVLGELQNIRNRTARFVSVIAYQTGRNEIYYFKGMVEGSISEHPTGHSGFGYDPVFIPKGFDQTFSMLPASLKNQVSHRSKSLHQFIQFLQQH